MTFTQMNDLMSKVMTYEVEKLIRLDEKLSLLRTHESL